MEVLAIIPARGGSKRVPRKNLLPLLGKPLLAHTIEHALGSSSVTKTVVSTEDPEIAAIAQKYGAQVVARPAELATDTATSESALLHVLDTLQMAEGFNPDLVVFLQCTSPIRRPTDIDNAVRTLQQEGADSLLAAVRYHRHIWGSRDRALYSINYDFTRRLRSQEAPLQYLETGSIYVFKPWVLRQGNNRLGGKLAVYEMDYWGFLDIDTREDFELCEWVLQKHGQERRQHTLPTPIRAIFFDFDGVFTDNQVLVHQDGTEAVLCDRADGLGLDFLKSTGMPLGVLSTERNPVVAARCAKLAIPCYQGLGNKRETLERLLKELDINAQNVIYVGNDVNDLGCMQAVGCGVAVADAHPAVRATARIVLERPGGHGAVREVCDLIMAALQR